MSEVLPVAYMARHGNTAWTLTGQHTGLTDLPLTPDGERNAVRLGGRLQGLKFNQIFTSPLQRALRTCELAGFGAGAEIDPDLVEWNYGKYEGRTSAEILRDHPDWQLFRDGAPGGESPEQVGERADRVVQACPQRQRKRAAIFEWPLYSHVDRPLARTGSWNWRQVFSAQPGKSERAQLRAQSLPACDPAVE
jgi:broad specificity phosphatase PhoE